MLPVNSNTAVGIRNEYIVVGICLGEILCYPKLTSYIVVGSKCFR